MFMLLIVPLPFNVKRKIFTCVTLQPDLSLSRAQRQS